MIGIIGEDGITTITTYGIDHQDRPVLTLVDRPYIDPLVPILGSLFRDRQDRALVDLLPNLDRKLASLHQDQVDLPFRDHPPDREVIVL